MYADCVVCFFFFFQAEDGIRDLTVTGVQTCALPIWLRRQCTALSRSPPAAGRRGARQGGALPAQPRRVPPRDRCRDRGRPHRRSEERRVGKEYRSRRLADAQKKRARIVAGTEVNCV